jgi:hypothetical protein
MYSTQKIAIALVAGMMYLVIACKQKAIEKPDKLIDEPTMASILTDIHILEAKINDLNIPNSDSASFIYRKLEKDIYKKYQVDTASYKASYKYYLGNIDQFEGIYNNVIKKLDVAVKADSAQKAKNKNQAPIQPPPGVLDSIAKANNAAAQKTVKGLLDSTKRLSKKSFLQKIKK